MDDFKGMNFGLGTLPLLSNAKSRSISAENPKGDTGEGGREKRDT